MTHADAVELWQWCETVLFGRIIGSDMLAMSPRQKPALTGIVLFFLVWLTWAVLFRFADGYRNVNLS